MIQYQKNIHPLTVYPYGNLEVSLINFLYLLWSVHSILVQF